MALDYFQLQEIAEKTDALDEQAMLESVTVEVPGLTCQLCKYHDDRRNCCLIKREPEWVGEWQQWLLAYRTPDHPACEELVVEFEHF